MRWKYKVIALSNDARSNEKPLTKLGSSGWELVAIQGNQTEQFAYLKMEVEETPRGISF